LTHLTANGSGMAMNEASASGWIHDHDDRWLWTVLYVGGAVVLSIFISLFWLVALVAIHGALEWVRQRRIDPNAAGVIARVAWELKLDIALVLFAFVVALYMDLVLGMAGLGGAARVGAQVASRGGAWARAIRGVLLSIDDAAQLVRAASRGDAGGDGGGQRRSMSQTELRWGGWLGPWGVGAWLSLGLAGASMAMIAIVPLATGGSVVETAEQLLMELHPWPSKAELVE